MRSNNCCRWNEARLLYPTGAIGEKKIWGVPDRIERVFSWVGFVVLYLDGFNPENGKYYYRATKEVERRTEKIMKQMKGNKVVGDFKWLHGPVSAHLHGKGPYDLMAIATKVGMMHRSEAVVRKIIEEIQK